MIPANTISDLFDQLGEQLELKWDRAGENRPIMCEAPAGIKAPPVGPFNMIRPNRIQIIGPPEQKHIQLLAKQDYHTCLRKLYDSRPAAIIFTNDLTPYAECAELAAQTSTPLLHTSQPDFRVISLLLAYFSQPRSETSLVHGVFMEVLGKGVLLSGEPAVGKSELALALLSRGHRLIADDATEFTRVNNTSLSGRCPPVLQDFLEVRGLGLINVRAMFGNSVIKPRKNLHLIIQLEIMDDEAMAKIDRLNGSHSSRTILDVPIPQTTLPVAPGRNLAIQVETTVRQHLLNLDGYSAADDFSKRQQDYIERQED